MAIAASQARQKGVGPGAPKLGPITEQKKARRMQKIPDSCRGFLHTCEAEKFLSEEGRLTNI